MDTSLTAFASYRLPGETTFISVGTDKEVVIDNRIDLTQTNRFYLTSFDKKVLFYFTPTVQVENTFLDHTSFTYNRLPAAAKKSAYLHQIESIKRKIASNEFEKVVLSRVKLIDKTSSFDAQEVFLTLCKTYPNAFVYLFYSELSGYWIGATPELLLEKKEETYHTVALAGTKLMEEDWTKKEEDEQQFVTDYILNSIKDTCKKIEVSPRMDATIGKIKHLKTAITFEPYLPSDIPTILDNLQPTPAVCGIPKEESMEYIKKLESHSRSFYTGAIGPVGIQNQTKLFVNLRCMQVGESKLALYVGGGITKDSIGIKEWEETERKSMILIQAVEKSQGNLAV